MNFGAVQLVAGAHTLLMCINVYGRRRANLIRARNARALLDRIGF
jgi:hypothetical protein